MFTTHNCWSSEKFTTSKGMNFAQRMVTKLFSQKPFADQQRLTGFSCEPFQPSVSVLSAMKIQADYSTGPQNGDVAQKAVDLLCLRLTRGSEGPVLTQAWATLHPLYFSN